MAPCPRADHQHVATPTWARRCAPLPTLRALALATACATSLANAQDYPNRSTKQRMAADGTEPFPSTPDEYAADIDREETKWSAIVKKSAADPERAC
jgi:hypothetical protein